MLIWKNHQFVSASDQATLAELIPQFSFFETFALRNGMIVSPEAHEVRLVNSLKKMGLNENNLHLNFTNKAKNWKPILENLLTEEKLKDAIVRWVVVPDEDKLTEWVSVRPLPQTPTQVGLIVLKTTRDVAEWLPRPKTGPWINSQIAWNELKTYTAQTDVEGIQLDKEGYVSDGTRSALVWSDGVDWFAPHNCTQRLFSTTLLTFEDYLKSQNQTLKFVTQGLPLRAKSFFILRSTFESGAVLVDKITNPAGELLWIAASDQSAARDLITQFKKFRNHRSVSLL